MKKEKLVEMIKRVISEENLSGKRVLVAGDRGYGKFQVTLVKRRIDLEQSDLTGENEEIWEVIDPKNQEISFVVRGQRTGPAAKNLKIWGEVDPFIEEN